MNTVKWFTEKDCRIDETGDFSIAFNLPSTGERYVMSSSSPDSVVSFVNQQIRSDLQRKASQQTYRDGVAKLLEVAMTQDGSGGEMAAQVLLSVYNNNFPLETARLTVFDQDNLGHALAVISGRAYTLQEPQEVIPDGKALFSELSKRWAQLSIKYRS